jgi:hypothetical protein
VHAVCAPRQLLQHRASLGAVGGLAEDCTVHINRGVASHNNNVSTDVSLSNELRFCESQSLHVCKRCFTLQRSFIDIGWIDGKRYDRFAKHIVEVLRE